MKRSALTHRHHGRHHRWNILLYLNQLQGHLYAETHHATEDLWTILNQLDVSSRTSLFLWGTNVDCICVLTHQLYLIILAFKGQSSNCTTHDRLIHFHAFSVCQTMVYSRLFSCRFIGGSDSAGLIDKL